MKSNPIETIEGEGMNENLQRALREIVRDQIR